METPTAEDWRLTTALSSESRDFLIFPSGDKVSVKDLEGKTIGLYFAANWYTKCEFFNQVLAKEYLKLKEQGSEFEIVFISSDEDNNCFEIFHGKMPWPAIPFYDLQSKRGLTEKFDIEGIPTLILLSPKGELLQTDGVELIERYGYQAYPFTLEKMAELEAEEKARHASQTLEKLLVCNDRDYVVGHNQQVPVSDLVGKTIGLYFSASWCAPCSKFTSKLVSIYESLRRNKKDFEVVFVSLDKEQEGYAQCFNEMPWFALPFDKTTSRTLSRYFDIRGIPSLIIVGPDGKTVTKDGTYLIKLHLEMAFPFTEAQMRFLQGKMDEEAKKYPQSVRHVGHQHVLKLVSENSGGGPFICCECEEPGSTWAYQCLDCGYEVHLKCVKEVGKESGEKDENGDEVCG